MDRWPSWNACDGTQRRLEKYGIKNIPPYPSNTSVRLPNSSTPCIEGESMWWSLILIPKNNFLYSEIVFTGENEDSLNLVSTFTNYIQNHKKNNKFIKIRSAYFSLVDLYEEPETEIELIVYEDGLVKSVIFDYIDYEIKGVLLKHKYILDLKC